MDSKTVQRSALCRSRRELSNAYLIAKIGVDTAENEPLKVWGENSIQYSLQSLGVNAWVARESARRRGRKRAVPRVWPLAGLAGSLHRAGALGEN